MKLGSIVAGAAMLLSLAGCNSNVQEQKSESNVSPQLLTRLGAAPPLGVTQFTQSHFAHRQSAPGVQPAPSRAQSTAEISRIRAKNMKQAGRQQAAKVMGGAAIDCDAAGNTPTADDASGLSGSALVNYFASKPNSCTNSASTLFGNTPKTFALWSDANVATLANAIADRAATYSTSNQQGVLPLMTAIRAAYYVQWYSQGGIPAYSAATQSAVGNALSKMASTQAFSAIDGGTTVAGVFDLANGAQQGDRIFNQTMAYASATLVGGDAYKTDDHLQALNSMYQMLFRMNTNKPAAWAALMTDQPASAFDPLKKLASYMSYALAFNNGYWASDAQAAVYEFTRLLTYSNLRSYVDDSMGVILAAYPKFSAPYLAAAVNYDYYKGDCARFGICKATLTDGLKAKAFPNSFSFDDGNVVVYTAVSKQKMQQLYHAMKQVEAQFKRKTQQDTPVDGDPNKVLKMYVYGSRADYENYQQFLFGGDTNNGGVYVERDGTFYTYERTPADSIYTLEELLRHEYVHYLSSRFTIPGMWGDDPYYTNERLTWFEEGMAEFFAGSTQADGILHRKDKIEGIRNDGANRMTVPEILTAKYGNFRFYDYATAMMYYLNEKRPQTFIGLFQTLRNGDVSGFDALTSGLKSDGNAQTDFTKFTDGLVSEYPTLPDFHEGSAFDPDTFRLSDVTQVATAFAGIDSNARCTKAFNAMNQRVGCSGYLSATSAPETTLNAAIKSLLATGVNNWKTLNCYYIKQSDGGSNYYCEVGIRDAAVPQKLNTAPILTDKGSTVNVKSGETACLRADATDADGDIVVGYWQQKSGLSVPLSRGQTDVQFGSCISPAPDVASPQTLVFELVANDGKDEVRLEHTLTVLPKAGGAPLAVTASTSTSTVSHGATVTLTANVATGTQATFAWTQTAGPTVSLSASNAGSTSFTAPTLNADTPLTFRVTATSAGQTATADVTVTVRASAEGTTPTTPNTPSQSGGKGGGGSADMVFAGLIALLLVGTSRQRKTAIGSGKAKWLAAVFIAIGLAGCAQPTGIYRANMVTYGRIVKMFPLPAPVDAFGRAGRWTMQYDVLLANGETLQVVTDPDPTARVTDCVEIGYVGTQVVSLAVIDPNIGCKNIDIPDHPTLPLFQ